jgi:hypothetical protein
MSGTARAASLEGRSGRRSGRLDRTKEQAATGNWKPFRPYSKQMLWGAFFSEATRFLQIPTEAGREFRTEAGLSSDLKPARIPI